MTEPARCPSIPDRRRAGRAFDAKDPETSYPPIEQVRPPAGAPNVLVILIDDVGFGVGAFGGPCHTPVAEQLAANGLKFTRFHTTALCSPTRAALLSGGNHHSVGMGGITEIATSAPTPHRSLTTTPTRRPSPAASTGSSSTSARTTTTTSSARRSGCGWR